MYKIYTLSCPITKKIKYVGKTKQSIYSRLNSHLTEVGTSSKNVWISDLKNKGLIPIVEVLDEVYNNDLSNEFEYYWILQCRAWGYDLVNSKQKINKFIHIKKTKKINQEYKINNNSSVYRSIEKIVTELIKIRKDAKFTQEFMADWLKVSRKKLNEFENGSFDFDLMVNYCDKLGIDLRLNYFIT